MLLYQYVKTPSKNKKTVTVGKKVVPFFFMTVGISILLWTSWPIVTYGLVDLPGLTKAVSPVGNGEGSLLVPVVLGSSEEASSIDFTDPNIWYPTSPQKKVVTPVNSYKLSIPKLRIFDALVLIAGDDLNKSIIHYGGTGLPGGYGSAVMFGHSVLPQFFDPKNYRTIFSTLPTLKNGDDIFVTYDGITFRYRVFDMTVTEPNDLSSLEQRFDDSYVTLITCVPPGTYWKRLNIKARLIKPLTT